MPELPEVETIRRSLIPKLVGRVIDNVELIRPEILINESGRELTGWLITGLRRRGKYLLIDAVEHENVHSGKSRANSVDIPEAGSIDAASITIVIHLRMTGQLLLDETGEMTRDHVHIRFKLSDPSDKSSIYLLFRDVRRFGRIWYFPGGQESLQSGLAALGPEPLSDDWSIEQLTAGLARHPKSNIKNVLLNQHVVAGLGNIYVDEALFRSGISPLRMASSLDKTEIKKLYAAIRTILEKAIGHRGTSFRDYVDGLNTKGHFQYELKVYSRGGLECPVCGQTILKRRIAGRGTCSCPHCQPDPGESK
jgi:formamidopyrimidine-DNA glycosylase